jgi:hypothetical protein
LGSVTGYATLKVGAALVTITVNPNTAGIVVGQTQQFTATGHYSDGSTLDLTSQVTWASSKASVTTITSGGLATGVAVGLSTISSTQGSVTGYATLTVRPPKPTFTPLPGSYGTTQSVKLKDAVAGAAIYYTLDGSMPTQFSYKYDSTHPIIVDKTTTIQAAALVNGIWSDVATGVYMITAYVVKLSATSLTFNTQVIGTTSAGKSVTVKNSGAATLTITGITIGGTNPGDFSRTTTCGATLSAGTSCTITVKFSPTASGTRTAALNLTDNAPDSPQTVTLTGTGTAVKLSPTSLGFGTAAIGTSTAPKTVTLTNVGTTTLTISGFTVTGLNAGDYSATTTCGASLAAGAQCTFQVTFKPTAGGSRAASLSVSDDAVGSPQTVKLSGSGV